MNELELAERLHKMALPDPQDEREVWCAKELKEAEATIRSLVAERDALRAERDALQEANYGLALRLNQLEDERDALREVMEEIISASCSANPANWVPAWLLERVESIVAPPEEG